MDARGLGEDLGLMAGILHRLPAGLIVRLPVLLQPEGDPLQGHVAARQDLAGEPSDSVDVPRDDPQLMARREAGDLCLAAVGAGARRRWEDLHVHGADVVALDREPLEAHQDPVGGGAIEVRRLRGAVGLRADRDEDPRQIRLQLNLARAGHRDGRHPRRGGLRGGWRGEGEGQKHTGGSREAHRGSPVEGERDLPTASFNALMRL